MTSLNQLHFFVIHVPAWYRQRNSLPYKTWKKLPKHNSKTKDIISCGMTWNLGPAKVFDKVEKIQIASCRSSNPLLQATPMTNQITFHHEFQGFCCPFLHHVASHCIRRLQERTNGRSRLVGIGSETVTTKQLTCQRKYGCCCLHLLCPKGDPLVFRHDSLFHLLLECSVLGGTA